MASAEPVTDHRTIREWAEARGAKPACVRGAGGKGDTGMIRLDFPGYSGGDSLEPISWDEWFKAFDENKLALQLLNEHDLISETSFVLGFPHETPERVKETLALAKEYDPDFAHFLAIAPWPYAAMWKDLEPHVVSRDWRRYNLIDPVVKPIAMSLRDIDDAIIDCYRKFYFSKGTQLLAMKPGFRREYVFKSMKLIMQSSFVKKKMLGRAMPEEVKTLLAALGRQSAAG